MQISFLDPLSRAWTRMKLILFSPFDLTKWIVLGFTAWLADLTDTSYGSGSGGKGMRGNVDFDDWWESCSDFAYGTAETIQDILIHSLGAFIITMVVLGALALWVLLLWLSSRGSFMFLDNVVHNRAKVKETWSHFKQLGNSLFVWRIVFTLICLLAIGPLIGLAVVSCLPMILSGGNAILGIPGLIGVACMFILFAIAAAFVDFFLLHLVVPVMYKHDLPATAAWRRFLPVLRQKLPIFLLYGLFVLLLNVCVAVAVVLFGLLTCCIGWLVLIIPVIGATLMLPVYVTLRVYDIEFLAQFGADYDVVGRTPAA